MSYKGSTLNRSDIAKYSPALPNTSEKYEVAQRVKEISALKQLSVTETLAIPAGIAGTTGIISLTYNSVYDNNYAYLATTANTSLALTSTALITEVEMDMSSNMTDVIATLANGEYVVDYESGVIGFKKADASISMSATYFVRIKATDATFGGTISLGSAKLEDGSTTTKATINAANTTRTAATTVICVQPVDSLGNIIDATPKTIVGDVKSVTTAGVRVALGTTMAARQIYIKANITNTGNIYVGGVTVTSANGITLAAGDSITLNISDRATVYLDSDVSLEGVGYTLLN